MPQENIRELLNDPLAQKLLNSTIPARLAYTGLDGFPRAIPIWFLWDGARVVLGTPPNAQKVKALAKNPNVALTIDTTGYPPEILLMRGIAKIEMVDGPAPEFLAAGRKYLGEEQGREFEAYARQTYKQMARILIEPDWVKILDFQTRLPSAMAGS